MTISVALCTYNGAQFIADQIASILSQDRPVDELVIADDGSADDTVAIAIAAIAAHPRGPGVSVRVLESSTRLGVTANFARALDACSGDLLVLSDQDDVWHADRVSRMVRMFDDRPTLLLAHGDARIVDGDGEPTGELLFQTLGVTDAEKGDVHAGRALQVLLRRNIVTGATTMLRRELVASAAPFPASWVHDEWLAVIAAVSGGVDLLEAPLIDYRIHGGNQIGASSLTASGRVQRLRAPRTERNARLLARAEALAERLPLLSGPASGAVIEMGRQKLEHERARSSLPARRLPRIGPVLREWRTGRYASAGLGAQDVLRDLVQPV
ncbi:glycosyltransferase family 2 protein [Leifsonia sp. YIM 134122]|uniref:Glycosyltransferase family 2 protein n=1 Tax=Leifsonia stereocauli TaxID=3134136 RepID=A0ABU9W3G9_9MICO